MPQKSWLMNSTIRENIVFGRLYHRRRFDRIIKICCLQPDLDILPEKDLTVIGDQGINLSGGQKQRIAIARALYSKATVLILVSLKFAKYREHYKSTWLCGFSFLRILNLRSLDNTYLQAISNLMIPNQGKIMNSMLFERWSDNCRPKYH